MKTTCGILLLTLCTFIAFDARGQNDPEPPVPPLEPWVPTAKTFNARLKAMRDHEKKYNRESDTRISTTIFLLTARSEKRRWLKARMWTDDTHVFVVSMVPDVAEPLAAIDAAEKKARAMLQECQPGNTKRMLDWYIDDDGKAWALTGCPKKIDEPTNE
ncbi:MAG: hypothetical protein AAF658_16265 [Myxococcota bacterium]